MLVVGQKYSIGIALTEVIQFASVILMEEGVHNDESATELIADALNWLVDGDYISYDGDNALCNAKYILKGYR